MSDDIVEQLDRGYRLLWRERRPQESLGALAPDFEWVVPDHPEGEIRRGPEGVLEFVREWVEPWDDLHVEWTLERGTQDHVLAIVDMRGRGRDSGVPTEMSFWQVWTFRDGRPVRCELYWDEEAGRRAAGLPAA